MSVVALTAAALAMGPMPHGGDAVAPVVGMQNKAFSPAALEILVGDTVGWKNDDGVDHIVYSADGGLDSGRIQPGATFTFTPQAQGTLVYNCPLHRFMNGRLDVRGILLDRPGEPGRPGAAVTLAGRAPAGVGDVALEAQAAADTWTPVAHAATGDGGAFTVSYAPRSPVMLRARSGALLSRPVHVAAAAALDIRARRRGDRVVVRVRSTPAQPRAALRLERYDRDHFAWRRWRTARLGRASRATLTLSSRGFTRVRAVLPRGVGGYGRAVSRAVSVRSR